MSKSPITCHVLDSSLGKPAAGVQVHLQQCHPEAFDGAPIVWEPVAKGVTDSNGRCSDLCIPAAGAEDDAKKFELVAGRLYKIVFKTKEYFDGSGGRKCFYPWVEIPFEVVNPDEHYHIPLLLSPYSYTTYRGS